MATDSELIRTLIERWAEAVHTGDMDGVLADHTEDMVMFDVPPPYEGVHGIDAYRETWPGFFEWQRQGASFEIESLDVTAGDDIAYACALLRCATRQELADRPEMRLRLTLGLRKENGRWVVAHEHHSFPHADPDPDTNAVAQVRRIHENWFDRTAAKDLDGLMAAVAEDVVSYEHDGPLQYLGRDDVREVCRRGLDSAPGAVSWDVPGLRILARDDLAVAWGLDHVQDERATIETWSRGTRVFQRREGAWRMVHQHLSSPHDPVHGEGDGAARTDPHP